MNASKQRGAVLIISLILLTVITLVVVSGASSTMLEEKKAASIQYKAITYQAAESSIKRSWGINTLTQSLNQYPVAYTEDHAGFFGKGVEADSTTMYRGMMLNPSSMELNADLSSSPIALHLFEVEGESKINAVNARSRHVQMAGRIGPSNAQAPLYELDSKLSP